MLSSFGKVNIDFTIRKTMPNRRGVSFFSRAVSPIYIFIVLIRFKAVYLSVFGFSFGFLRASPFIKIVNLIK